jgi:hypothetical protein
MVEEGEYRVYPQAPAAVSPEVEVGPVRALDLEDPLQLRQLDAGVLGQAGKREHVIYLKIPICTLISKYSQV